MFFSVLQNNEKQMKTFINIRNVGSVTNFSDKTEWYLFLQFDRDELNALQMTESYMSAYAHV